MSDVMLFTKPDCPKCDYVKQRIPEGLEVQVIDASTPDGMAEAAFYELLEKPTPILVVDEEPVIGAIRILKRLNALTGQQH